MINEKDIALIDAFIAGELIGNDKTDFEMRVRKDLEFAKAVRQQIHAVEHLEIFGAVQMGATLRGDMSTWKQQGGYKPYKSEMLAKSMMLKVISTIVVLAAAAGAVWYFVLREAPPKVEPAPIETPEEVQYEPEPPATTVDTTMSSESYTELKTSDDQIADIQLNIQDPTTFSIVELSAEDGVYTYEISYDGQSQVIKSRDPDMDDRLTKMADDAIEENEQNVAPVKTTAPKQRTTTNTQPPAKEDPVKKVAEPVKKPATQPKPTIKKPKEKVVDDFPY